MIHSLHRYRNLHKEKQLKTVKNVLLSITDCNKFCKLDECYFPVPTDCRRFIRCTSVPNGYIGYDYACPMGTKYDKDGHCIHAPDDKCLYSKC